MVSSINKSSGASSSGIKDANYWNNKYGDNYVASVTNNGGAKGVSIKSNTYSNSAMGGNINETVDIYEDTSAEANSQVNNTWIENGVIYKTITLEDGTTKTIEVGNVDDLNGSTIDPSQIDWSCIASNANDALNGNFFDSDKVDTQYWGNNGTLTIKILDNGAILILENGVPMGWTTINGIDSDLIGDGSLEFGKYIKNTDGSIEYINARGETIVVEESDIFVDENGNKFFISDIDENGNVVGIMTLNDDYSMSGYSKKNGNTLDSFFDGLKDGSYFQTSDGSIIYKTPVSNDFKTVDSSSIYEINGEKYFVSRTDANGNVTGMIKIGENLEGIYSTGLSDVLGNLNNANDAVVCGDGSIIYNDGNGNFATINGENMVDFGGQKYLVTSTDQYGKITGLVGFNSETGKLNGYYSTIAENIVNQIEPMSYTETANGDIIYNDGMATRYISSDNVTIDANGNKIVQGQHNTDIVFQPDGNITTEVRPISESTTETSTTNSEFSNNNDSTNSNVTPTEANPSNSSSSNSTVTDLGLGFKEVKNGDNVAAIYSSKGELAGLNIDGKQYKYNSADGTYSLVDGGNKIVFNNDGSFKQLISEGYLVTKNDNGVLHNIMNSSDMSVPSDMANLCNDISIGEIPKTIEIQTESTTTEFNPPQADLEFVAKIEKETGIGPTTFN